MSQKESTPSDEIDFEPLFNSLFRRIKKATTAVSNFIRLAYRLRLRVIAGAIIGALLGIGLAFIIPPYYKVRMSISSSYVSGFFLEQYIYNLQFAIDDKNYALLGQKLNLSEEKAEYVKSIQPYYFNTINEYNDTIYSESFYFITAHIYNKEFIGDFQEGLMDYLKNNPFVKSKSETKKDRYTKIIARIEEDIQAIDSLLVKINKNIGASTSNQTLILGDPINPTELLSEKDRLYNQLLKYNGELANIDDIKLIQSFDKIIKPFFPKKSNFAIIGFILGGLIALIYSRQKEKAKLQS